MPVLVGETNRLTAEDNFRQLLTCAHSLSSRFTLTG